MKWLGYSLGLRGLKYLPLLEDAVALRLVNRVEHLRGIMKHVLLVEESAWLLFPPHALDDMVEVGS